ncbi:MAG: hypothetical protein EB127_17890 [Alphaproteobacteria bacterium]|nr:hypothetical protein [Alphaproteobacteria bacterium]
MKNELKQRLDGLLFAVLGDSTLVERWWYRPNKGLNDALPIDVYVLSPELVKNYIFEATNNNGDFD